MVTSALMTEEDKAFCERYRNRLMMEFTENEALIAGSVENCAPVQLDQQSVGRLARMDAMQVQAMAQDAARRYQIRRLGIIRTLARMDEGEFGYCTECGEPIGSGRLDVDPTFHTCIGCAGR
ncbi:TraR/DksA C4-type zinc finger protein [Micromonospora sp. STR1s_5]|nr:TraR/DksA C4-type zinc finger protein [Micromonospora sp. STR1s_5]